MSTLYSELHLHFFSLLGSPLASTRICLLHHGSFCTLTVHISGSVSSSYRVYTSPNDTRFVSSFRNCFSVFHGSAQGILHCTALGGLMPQVTPVRVHKNVGALHSKTPSHSGLNKKETGAGDIAWWQSCPLL